MSVQRFQSGKSQVIVTLNDEKFGRVLGTFAGEEAKRKATRVARFAREEAPVGKGPTAGNLRNQIRVEQSRDVSGKYSTGYDVVSNADYSVFVHEGTRPHKIEGKPLLGFMWPKIGQFVVFHSVNHPGTKPNRFMARAVRRAR